MRASYWRLLALLIASDRQWGAALHARILAPERFHGTATAVHHATHAPAKRIYIAAAVRRTAPQNRRFPMKKQFAVVAAVAALALSANCRAEGLRPVIGASLTGGGKTLVSVKYTDGSTQEIRSGGFLHLFGGAEYETEQFALQGNFGFHVDDTSAKDGSVKFSRWPIELIGLWKVNPTIRWGMGLRKSTGAKITSSGAASNIGSQKFDSKPGLILQGEYLLAPNLGGLLRVVTESYEVAGIKVQGNHVGLGVNYRF
jgi:hypothetical protein